MIGKTSGNLFYITAGAKECKMEPKWKLKLMWLFLKSGYDGI